MRFSDLQALIRTGATLLTPNQRSAQLWRDRLVHADPALRPIVLPWAAWKETLWQSALVRGEDDRVLLNPVQAADLWSQILQASHLQTLRPVRSLVQLCLRAQALVHGYDAVERQLNYVGDAGTDTAQFADWFRTFTGFCKRDRLLSASALDDALIALSLPRAGSTLLLLGLDTMLPSEERLVQALRDAGVQVETVDPANLADPSTEPAVVLRCADGAHEHLTMVATLQDELQRNASAITVVLPDADASRLSLERYFRRGWSADSVNTEPWEFACGESLATLPIVADALSLLQWTLRPATVATAGLLLRSPYLKLGVTAEAAGELDAEILRAPGRLRPEWTLQDLAHACRHAAPAVHTTLRLLASAADNHLQGYRGAGGWTEAVTDTLRIAGWPGDRTLTSTEFQAVDRWNDLLGALASLDLFDRTMSPQEFLARLEEQAREMRFSPQNAGEPIQVLSPDEAAGTTSGLLWFAHADEMRWSGRRSTSPLLSWSLQTDFGMPGTDPVRDAAEHRRATERLFRSAARVIVSYSATDRTGDIRRAPVLDTFDQLVWKSAPLPNSNETEPALERCTDDTGPALAANIGVLGGVGVLQSQAACAFRAFAERRLYSTELEIPEVGYDPRERGNLLHKTLELFWMEVRTQSELLRLQRAGSLDDAILRHVDAGLFQVPLSNEWSRSYVRLQRQRLHRLVSEWLEFEAERPDFEVLAAEREVETGLGPLRFRVRVDRTDVVQTADGPALVLIDYKTGSPSASGWMGARPEEPQLPFYAVAADLEGVQAIAFATVKPGERHLGLRSFPPSTALLSRGGAETDPEQFQAQLEEWSATLHRLCADFSAGDALVDPKSYPQTCTHCGQRMLCRLNPEALQDEVVKSAEVGG